MSSEKQIFANGRIAVLSTKLFAADKFFRLAESNSLAEALRLLTENGYGSGVSVDNVNDYDAVLRAELDQTLRLTKELCFDKNTLGFLLCPYDFANAKTLMKAKYMRIDGTSGCFDGATYLPKQMQEDFVNDNYGSYPSVMAEACDNIDDSFADGQRSPSTVDNFLDKAMYKQMRLYAQRSSLPLVGKLCSFRIDATNLVTLARAKKAGFDQQRFEQLIVEGGKVGIDTLCALWRDEDKTDELSSSLKAVYAARDDVAAMEEVKRKTEFQLISADADELSAQPSVLFFARKSREIDIVRTILIGVKKQLPKQQIKQNIVM